MDLLALFRRARAKLFPSAPHPDHLHYSIYIKGRVQGVWFRSSAARKAKELKLKGVAGHSQHDELLIEVEGLEKNLKEFLDWCKEGPPLAKVEELRVEERPPEGYRSFQIQ